MAGRTDETRHRLLGWTAGSDAAERLAAQALMADGYTSVDPVHPRGGPDGGSDAIATRDGRRWVVAVYFPEGQDRFSDIRAKFLRDARGVEPNDAHGIVFVTNQHLTKSQRRVLAEATDHATDLFHLERLTALLDQPTMRHTRLQFHLEDDMMYELLGQTTGGDSFAYVMLYDFDLAKSCARTFVVIRQGRFPLHDLRFDTIDMIGGRRSPVELWGELNSPADFRLGEFPVATNEYRRYFFFARNGSWHQDLILRRSDQDNCWLAATKVFGHPAADEWTHLDPGFVNRFGAPEWQG